MLIAIEGIDGSGKTTQVELLTNALIRLGHQVVSSKEPTDGQYGKLLRESAFSGRKAPEEELDLFIKDRKEHVSTLIKPEMEQGKTVILDRYYFSTIAYQSARGLDAEDIKTANEAFAPKPDFLFILTISIDESLKRIGIRDGSGNDFEGRENLEKCHHVFKEMKDDFIYHIDAQQSPEKVNADILEMIAKHPQARA